MPLGEFKGRYKFLAPKGEQKKIFGADGPKELVDQVKALVVVLPDGLSALVLEMPPKGMIVGRTKVFIKRKASYALERGLDISVTGHLVNIQRIYRGRIVRRRFKILKEGVKHLVAFMHANPYYRAEGPENIAITKMLTTDAIRLQVEKGRELIKDCQHLPSSLPHPGRLRTLVARTPTIILALADRRHTRRKFNSYIFHGWPQ